MLGVVDVWFVVGYVLVVVVVEVVVFYFVEVGEGWELCV